MNKIYLYLFSLFTCLNSYAFEASSILQEHIDSVQGVEYSDLYKNSKIDLKIQENTGSFSTDFKVPIVKNVLGFNHLSFRYSSDEIKNTGFGIGWKLELPVIYLHGGINQKTSYTVKGFNLTDRLIISDKKYDHFHKMLIVMGLPQEYEVYESELEGNFNKYLQFKDDSWLIISKDAKYYRISKEGLLLSISDVYNNIVHFSWNEDYLMEISLPDSKVKLEYIENSKFHVLYNRLVDIEKKISKITLEKNVDSREFKFTLNDGYLEKVIEKGSVLSLFEGEYAFQSHKDHAQVNFEANKYIVFDHSLVTPSVYPKDLEKKVYLDINSDNVSDFLSYSTNEYFKRIEALFSKKDDYHYVGGVWRPVKSIKELQSEIDLLKLHSSLSVSRFVNDSIRQYPLTFKRELRPFNVKVIEKEISDNFVSYDVKVVSNKILSLDITGDGIKEIIVCRGNYDLTRVESSVHAIFDFIVKGKADPSAYSQSAMVYSQEVVDNVLVLKGMRNVNLFCHQDSLIHDINGDGIVDFINGSEVYMGKRGNKYFDMKKMNLNHLFDLNSDLAPSEKNDSKGWQPYYSQSEKRFKIAKGVTVIKYPLTNISYLVDETATKALEVVGTTKKMTNIKSPYGGEILIDYLYQGKWVVNSVKKIGNDLIEEEKFKYHNFIINESSGRFSGFSVVDKETKMSSSQFKDSFRRTFFSNENHISKEFVLDKSLANGLVLSRTLGDVASVENSSGERHRNSTKWGQYKFDNDRVFIYPYESKKEIIFDDQIIRTRTKRTEYKFTPNGHLLEKIKSTFEDGLISSMGPFGDFGVREVISYRYDSNRLINNKISEERIDLLHKDSSKIEFKYSFEKGYLSRKIMNEDYYVELERDSIGRVIKLSDSNQDDKSFDYYDNSAFVRKYTRNNKVTNYKYDFLNSELVELIKPSKEKINFIYDSSQRPISIKLNDVEVIKSKYLDLRNAELDRDNNHESIRLGEWGGIRATKKTLPFETAKEEIYSNSYGQVYLIKSDDVISLEKRYDQFNRLTRDHDKLDDSLVESIYTPRGIQTYKNGTFVSSSQSQRGFNYSSEIYNGSTHDFFYSFGNKLRSIKGDIYDTNWKRNERSQVENVSIVGGDLDTNFSRDIFKDLLRVEYSDENQVLSIFKDEEGRVEAIDCESCSGLVSGENFYKDNLLIKEELLYGHQEKDIVYDYDFGQRKSILSDNYNLQFEYSNTGKLISKSFNSRKLNFQTDFSGNLLAIETIVDGILYNKLGLVDKINFSSGSSLSYIFDGRKVREISFERNNSTQMSYKIDYDNLNRVSSMSTKSKNDFSTNIEYDDNNKVRHQSLDSDFVRSKNGLVTKINNRKFSYCLSNLCNVGDIKLYYNQDGSLRFATKKGSNIFEKITDDTFMINGKIIHSIKVSGQIIAVLIDKDIFPVLSDHLGSVRAMFSQKGELLWERSFSITGIKTLTYIKNAKAKELEKLTVFSYAKLIEVPGADDLYWSNSRVYSSTIGEWMSLDPAFLWNPGKLFSSKGNWNPFEYCNGDPVNFVDPSGHLALPAMAAGAIIGGVLGGITGAIGALATDSNLYSGIMVGATTGAFIGSGAALVSGITGTGTGAIIAQGSIGSIFGFTGNLVGQAGFTGKVDIAQSLVAGAGGFLTTSSSAALGHSLNSFSKDLGVGVSYMSTDLGLSFASERFGSNDFSGGTSSADSFFSSGAYNFSGSNSSSSSDFWSSNPYE